jgi:hypothetical protein
MISLAIQRDAVRFGDRFVVRFERTLRVPDDGTRYPLPPGLGRFEVHNVSDYPAVPSEWRSHDAVFITMYQSEALWLSFDSAPWKPSAVTIGVGGINAISGEAWPGELHDAPQNYLVCPPQLWLDGINAGREFVRQFVAVPLGHGVTVEGQLTGREVQGGLQIRVYDPIPGRFPDTAPPQHGRPSGALSSVGMGVVPGGQIDQKILQDPYGLDTWDRHRHGTLIVHLLNTEQYLAVTGRRPPPPPIDARTYTEHGFPWFRLYEEAPDVAPSDTLSTLRSLRELGDESMATGETSVEVRPSQLIELEKRGKRPPKRS